MDSQRRLAVVAAGTAGIYTVDVSNLSAPVILGSVSTGDAREVAIQGAFAFVADYLNSTTSVDISTPSTPNLLSHISDPNLGGYLQDIVINGQFALAADVKFVNGIPITDISNPSQLQARAILNFPQRDDNGMGIAADGSYVYLVTEHNSLSKFGSMGDSRLYIGLYRPLQDLNGVPPVVTISSPITGGSVISGAQLPIIVSATDDVAVAGVNFLVNGQVVFTATSSPYQYNFTVPAGISTLTIGATAVDFGSNMATAQNILVTVIPDPGTTVTGLVLDSGGNPVGGALATTLTNFSATTQSDGSFTIAGVPTSQGGIVVNVTATVNGVNSAGVSNTVPPVPGGTTDVGEIVARSLRQ
ncbi:MAG TPA: Ig-like domain-containing protein [Bryobacteraceae bacterium]|nr:Ig-like domain-containing protein [Bryobacteraceae bacterium]